MVWEFQNAQEHLNRRCELKLRRYGTLSGALPRDNCDLGMALGTAKIQTSITSLILALFGQVRGPSTFTQRVDVDRAIYS